MRTFAIGDIHGGLKALIQVLERAQVREQDKLIFLGDYVDGWSEGPELLDFLIESEKTHNCVFIKGNHDELLLQYLLNGETLFDWLKHGGQETKDQYRLLPKEKIEKHLGFLSSLKSYYVEEKKLFIHGGFTNMKGVEKEHDQTTFWWDRSLWETARSMRLDISKKEPLYPKRLKVYKEIYIGHTQTLAYGKTTPMNFANLWNIDTGAGKEGFLSMINIDTKEIFQSDLVMSLYPNEVGRNKTSYNEIVL